MYRVDAITNFHASSAGIGSKVTVNVLFIPNSFMAIEDKPNLENSSRGTFTGKLIGLYISEKENIGRMFFENGIEVIYDLAKLAELEASATTE